MMCLGYIIETTAHLKLVQIFYQILYRLHKPKCEIVKAPKINSGVKFSNPIAKNLGRDQDCFSFLNIQDTFSSWNMTEHGMLWAYNLNYMDWLGQDRISQAECEAWIDRFISDLPSNRVGLDPYPIALRSINWIKFFYQYPNSATKNRLNLLYSQIILLGKKLEYHLLANHLLEDAYALFIAAVFFNDERLYEKASKLLREQLEEQILLDGAHYEQSPMYHCIMLDRLLDSINIAQNNERCEKEDVKWLKEYAVRMLGHLESIMWKDMTIPLLNDAAYCIAPTPKQLFDYARRLGLSWGPVAMKECGYRKMRASGIEAIVDVGNITATYQPGHTHADTFNYELRIDGKPFVVDTGISTYDKTPRRQFERSTAAHNTVVVDGKDSSHVWGGFRVGKRCHVELISDNDSEIVAQHDGFEKNCKRAFAVIDDSFVVKDYYDGEAISIIHLTEDADLSRIKIEGADQVEITEGKYSTEYNRFIDCKIMKIHFCNQLKYTIK